MSGGIEQFHMQVSLQALGERVIARTKASVEVQLAQVDIAIKEAVTKVDLQQMVNEAVTTLYRDMLHAEIRLRVQRLVFADRPAVELLLDKATTAAVAAIHDADAPDRYSETSDMTFHERLVHLRARAEDGRGAALARDELLELLDAVSPVRDPANVK